METGMPRFCTASLFSDSGEVRSDLELHTPMVKGALIYIGLSDSGEAGSDFELYTLSEVEICTSFAGGAEPLPYGMRQIRVCTCFTVGVRGCNSA